MTKGGLGEGIISGYVYEILRGDKMDLKKELRECQAAAKEGYQLAQGKYDEIKDTLADVAVKISMTEPRAKPS